MRLTGARVCAIVHRARPASRCAVGPEQFKCSLQPEGLPKPARRVRKSVVSVSEDRL